MVLMNGTKRARHVSSVVNQAQGGGNKKAGFGPQVGRESYTSVVMGITTGVQNGRCCMLSALQKTSSINANVKQSRNTGSSQGNMRYWSIPGTGR